MVLTLQKLQAGEDFDYVDACPFFSRVLCHMCFSLETGQNTHFSEFVSLKIDLLKFIYMIE